MSAPHDEYTPSGSGVENPHTADTTQDEYKLRPGQAQSGIPVVGDDTNIEDPIDANTADSDATLARDDADAIDQSNILDQRTRGAKPAGGYQEPGDEEGLGGPEDGQSRVAGGPN